MFTVLVLFTWVVWMRLADMAQSLKQKAIDTGWHWWPADEDELDEAEKETQTDDDWWGAALKPEAQPTGAW